jgi:hypothetical protein
MTIAAPILERVATRRQRAQQRAPLTTPDNERAWSPLERRIAVWSAAGVTIMSVLYVPTMVAGIVAAGNMRDPLKDPYLGIMEAQIIVMAPLMVLAMNAVHRFAQPAAKVYSRVALSCMVLCAGLTTSVHFVVLTVGRRIDPASVPGYDALFGWAWPSVPFALDMLAWDWFLGLSLLLAAPAFPGGGLNSALRRGLILGGTLCIAGLLGPTFDMRLRWFGEIGYAVVFPAVCVLLAVAFQRTQRTIPSVSASAP